MIETYKVITLCGSTRFKEAFMEAQKELSLQRNIVISVGLFGHSGDSEVWQPGVKEMLDDMHLRKIDMADEIYVINVDGYVGNSTRREIQYAKNQGKPVDYFYNTHKKGIVAYAAALLAQVVHWGQIDKAGQDYYHSHLIYVARNGVNWKEKVVGMLHDASEDTEYQIPAILKNLKDQTHTLIDMPQEPIRMAYRKLFLEEMPEDAFQEPTEEEWDEIAEALEILNSHTAPSREAYIQRFKHHELALQVKLIDLEHNQQLSRIPSPTSRDIERIKRYKQEEATLREMIS